MALCAQQQAQLVLEPNDYRMLTSLAYGGYSGRLVAVWNDRSPFDGPGGLAIRARVRSYLRAHLIKDCVYGRWNEGLRVVPENEALRPPA